MKSYRDSDEETKDESEEEGEDDDEYDDEDYGDEDDEEEGDDEYYGEVGDGAVRWYFDGQVRHRLYSSSLRKKKTVVDLERR